MVPKKPKACQASQEDLGLGSALCRGCGETSHDIRFYRGLMFTAVWQCPLNDS